MGIRIPSFFGYFNASRGLSANQIALNTINHNISNVNTEGYSRQRVETTAGSAYPPATRSNFTANGQIGQGISVVDITRSHDNFLDTQIRIQTQLLGFQSQVQDALQQSEGVLGEPSLSGIDGSMTDFFAAAQALSIHPEDIAARASFLQSAQNMLDVFQQQARQLHDLRTNLVGDPNVPSTFTSSQAAITVDDINNRLTDIANLNAQILTVTASGATPNDLLDKRDQLLSELSQLINIQVDYQPSNQIWVSLAGTGDNLVRNGLVIDTLEAIQNPGPLPNPDDEPTLVQLVSAGTAFTAQELGGELGGILQVGSNDPNITTIRGLLEDLDTLLGQIVTEINNLQATGRDLNGDIPTPPDDEVFTNSGINSLDIFNYGVNTTLIQDPRLLAAAIDDAGAFAGIGDGRNALAIAALGTQSLAGLGNSNVREFFNATVSRLGVDSKAAQTRTSNLTNVVQQLEQRKQSVQGVNLEEEMIDLLRFQRGFEASAKVMSVIDSTIDTIINKLF